MEPILRNIIELINNKNVLKRFSPPPFSSPVEGEEMIMSLPINGKVEYWVFLIIEEEVKGAFRFS
jgi:hypothetical protein